MYQIVIEKWTSWAGTGHMSAHVAEVLFTYILS